MPAAPPPCITIYHHCEVEHHIDLDWLATVLARALPLCQAEATRPDAPLLHLTEIEASIVTDPTIAQVHADFLGDPTPTDVITFHHGEILASADTAAREAPAHGHPFAQELALYFIHGLMHLAGWDDHDAEEAAQMKEKQERVLSQSVAEN